MKPQIEVILVESEGILCLSIEGSGGSSSGSEGNAWENETGNEDNEW